MLWASNQRVLPWHGGWALSWLKGPPGWAPCGSTSPVTSSTRNSTSTLWTELAP